MFLVFDIGGTRTRMGLSHTGEKLDEVKLFPTNHNFIDAMEEMRSVAEEFAKGEKYHAVVGGVRAYDKRNGQLFNQPHFPMWVGEPLLVKMKEMWGESVYLENDAAMDGLGEAVYGGGKGSRVVGYVTLSTGVGGARITNGKIDETMFSFEPGNMLMHNSEGEQVSVENIISGTAIEKKYGAKPTDIKDQNVWNEITDQIVIFLNNVAVMWSPEVIVMGGAVPRMLNFEVLNEKLKNICKIYPETPRIVLDVLQEEDGLYGALAYLQRLP